MIVTRTCPMCGTVTHITVDPSAYARWQAGTYIQDAFPDLTPPERELLMTGIDADYWTAIFSEEN